MKPSQVLDAKADLTIRLRDPRVRNTWTEHTALDVSKVGERPSADDRAVGARRRSMCCSGW